MREGGGGGVGVRCGGRSGEVGVELYLPVQENFSKGGRAGIFDLYPVVGYLFVRCFLIFFGGRFGRVSRGTLPILASIHDIHVIKLSLGTFICVKMS